MIKILEKYKMTRKYNKSGLSNKKGIYKIINCVNYNFYIGSSNNLAKRCWEHWSHLNAGDHCNIHLQRAWKKYGGEKFFLFQVQEIFSDDHTEKQIINIEQQYIDKYWDNGKICYNIAKIADRPDNDLQKKSVNQLDKDTRKIIKTWSSIDEALYTLGIYGISLCCIGKQVTSGGFRWEYSNPKLAKQYTPKEYSDWDKGKKKVYKIDPKTNKIVEEYKSIADTADKNDCLYVNISEVCNGHKNHVNGFIFSFEKPIESISKSEIISNIITQPALTMCIPCEISYQNLRSLSTHIQNFHGMKIVDYTIKYILNGTAPVCATSTGICLNIPRYTTYAFKKYCKVHAKEAMSVGGKIGGKAEAWNKGETKETDERIAKQAALMVGPLNHFFGKHHTEETIEQLKDIATLTEKEILERFKERSDAFDFPDFNYEEYSSRQYQKIKCVCKKCGEEDEKTLQSLERGTLCKRCYPKTVSQGEIEVGDFIQNELNIPIQKNVRNVIPPKELDIYIPEHNFAIEYNGLHWHKENGENDVYNRKIHRQKFEECQKKGITLFQIYADEWETNKDLVKSMIASRLHKIQNKIPARKCEVKIVKNSIAKQFYESSHISGATKSKITFGLYYNNNLVCALSLRKPWQNDTYPEAIEISRFATIQNSIVIGGFSKLIKAVKKWALENNYKNIISYCDLRFGEGKVYSEAGFELIKEIPINYDYTDERKRFNRFKFKAQDGKSEKQVAEEAGVFKIYGCGNRLYKLSLI